jgi:hypothetical protein
MIGGGLKCCPFCAADGKWRAGIYMEMAFHHLNIHNGTKILGMEYKMEWEDEWQWMDGFYYGKSVESNNNKKT